MWPIHKYWTTYIGALSVGPMSVVGQDSDFVSESDYFKAGILYTVLTFYSVALVGWTSYEL